MKLTRFEDLECWQEATSLAIEIYWISGDGEIGKDFGFRDQLRRSGVSIASNIAEGKERETASEFIRFLYIAKGSAGELKTQLYIAKEVGYLEESKYIDLNKRLEKVSGMVGNLIKAIKRNKWDILAFIISRLSRFISFLAC
jgi:four helix bundle protein